MLSRAAFYNRALDENISITIYSSLASFITGLSGALRAEPPRARGRRRHHQRRAPATRVPLLGATDSLRDLGRGTSSQLAVVNRR